MMKRRTEEGEEIEMAGLWKGSVEQLEASVCFCSLELGSGVKTETATTCVCGGVCVCACASRQVSIWRLNKLPLYSLCNWWKSVFFFVSSLDQFYSSATPAAEKNLQDYRLQHLNWSWVWVWFFLITFVGFSPGAGASPPLSSRRLREMKLGFVMETAVALYLLLSPAQVPALTSQNRENSCAAYIHTRQYKRQKLIFFVRRCLITFACCDSSQLHRLPLVRRNSHVITSYVLSISPNPNRFLCLTSFIYKTTELEI